MSSTLNPDNKKESVEKKDLKKIIYNKIEAFPGLSLRELSRELDISPSLTKYYLDKLMSEKAIKSIKDGKSHRFFTFQFSIKEEDMKILKLLRNPVILEMMLLFLRELEKAKKEGNKQQASLRHVDLFKNMRFNSKGTITYYLKKLQEENLIEISSQDEQRYVLTNPDKIELLLKVYNPSPSIIKSFASLWTSFYSKKKK